MLFLQYLQHVANQLYTVTKQKQIQPQCADYRDIR